MTHAPDAMDPQRANARRDAFDTASRHSSHVRWAKRGIVIICVLAILVLTAIAWFDPFGRLPKSFSTAGASLNGSRITMEKPRLNGYREDGRPYDLRAASGVQDVKTPHIIELSEITAKFDTAEQSTVHLTAPSGIYDSSHDTMTLLGDIRISNDTGYDIRLKEANVNFKAGTVTSDKPFTVVMPGGAVAANRLLITENGKKISFLDGVETTLTPAVAPAATGSTEAARP